MLLSKEDLEKLGQSNPPNATGWVAIGRGGSKLGFACPPRHVIQTRQKLAGRAVSTRPTMKTSLFQGMPKRH